LRRTVDAGVRVTLGTYDPDIFGTSLEGEAYFALRSGLQIEQVVGLLREGFNASFLEDSEKDAYLATFEAAAASALKRFHEATEYRYLSPSHRTSPVPSPATRAKASSVAR
jgi:adenosine deaminase